MGELNGRKIKEMSKNQKQFSYKQIRSDLKYKTVPKTANTLSQYAIQIWIIYMLQCE